MAGESIDQMKDFIEVAEQYVAEAMSNVVRFYGDVSEPLMEEATPPSAPARHPIMTDLEDVAFRLRAFMESEGGDYGLGVETGMQRAAEMIENLLRRYNEDDGLGQETSQHR